MTDFPALDDDFGDAAMGGASGDWRARERELLGDDFGPTESGHDLDGSGSHFPSLDGSGDATAPFSPAQQQPQRNNDFVSSFERDPPPAAAAKADEMSMFETQFPEVEVAQPAGQQNGYHATSSTVAQQTPKLSSSQAAEPDTEAIKAWRDKRATEIAQRDEASKKKHDDIVERAEKAIDDFYQDYNAKKERQIAKNKAEEADFETARTDALAKGSTWERVAELVELQDSRSKTSTRSTRDVARFKEALLSLKRDGDNAPGAAGF